MGVMRLGYVHARVTDLAEAKGHYANTVGLEPMPEGRPGLLQGLGRVGPPLGRPRGGRRRAGQVRLEGASTPATSTTYEKKAPAFG